MNYRVECIKLWELSQNTGSKWYNQDRAEYIRYINSLPDHRVMEIYNNLACLAGRSESFNRLIEKETAKMDRAGMYDIKQMKPINQLD